MKSLRDNWAVLTFLAGLIFIAGGAYVRLSAVEKQLTIITAKLEMFQTSYITREEVMALRALDYQATYESHKHINDRLDRLENKRGFYKPAN